MPSIKKLIDEASSRDVEVVYVNDNYGDWSASAADLADRALAGAEPSLVEAIVPPDDMAFVVKARHSAFYETPLEYLLRHKNATVTREMIAREVWKDAGGLLTNTIDVYVTLLRKKVERPGGKQLIQTVRGVGYALRDGS